MNAIVPKFGLLLALGALAAPAAAQDAYSRTVRADGSSDPSAPKPAVSATAVATNAPCQKNITGKARKALIELQTAVNAKDTANIPAKLAAAQAVAKSPDDKCLIAMLQMQHASSNNDLAGIQAAIDAQVASGARTPAEMAPEYANLGRVYYNGKNYVGAQAAFARAAQLDPTKGDSTFMMGEALVKQGQIAAGLAQYQKGLAVEVAAGRKPPEDWFKRAVAVAYENKNPMVVALSRDWVAAYPSPKNWRDALRIYQGASGLTDAALIDTMRLQRVTKALAGESDYYVFADTSLTRGYPAEALAVLNEGLAANSLDRNRPLIKTILARATTSAAGNAAVLVKMEKDALASASATLAMKAGDSFFGNGDYAKAAAMYRAAMGKSGVDANVANLRLGMALTMSGDKAGAEAALKAVTGPQADTARYWLIYLAQRG